MSKQTEAIKRYREYQLYAANEKHIRQTLLRVGIKRNDQCWCGSKVKYKKCHWREDII